MTRRVGDITGLDMTTAEDLQVVNYGIGGHYEPHFDYARVYKCSFSFLKTKYFTSRRFFVLPASKCFLNFYFFDDLRLLKPSEVKAFQGLGTGNRIATWLMYVSANLLTVIFLFFFCLWLSPFASVSSVATERGSQRLQRFGMGQPCCHLAILREF